MDGEEFLRLCERDAVPCAGIIREQLKGWPKQVLDPEKLKQGRYEQAICPPHHPDPVLADLFVANVEKQNVRVRGLSPYEVIDEVFKRAFPACASASES